MRGSPLDYWDPPGEARLRTMSVSTTRTHGLKSIDEKYVRGHPSQRGLVRSRPGRSRSMKAGGPILGSPVLRRPFRQSAMLHDVLVGLPGDSGILRLALPFGRWQ